MQPYERPDILAWGTEYPNAASESFDFVSTPVPLGHLVAFFT